MEKQNEKVKAKYLKPSRTDFIIREGFSNNGEIVDISGSTVSIKWPPGVEKINLRELELSGTKQGKPLFKVKK